MILFITSGTGIPFKVWSPMSWDTEDEAGPGPGAGSFVAILFAGAHFKLQILGRNCKKSECSLHAGDEEDGRDGENGAGRGK